MLKKINALCIIFFLIFYQINSLAAIKNKIIAKVGNEIVTSYELESKIKSILILSNNEINQENIDKVKNIALKDLINLKLKKEEIEKYGIDISDNRVNSYIRSLGIDENKLSKIFGINDASMKQYFDQTKIELTWQKMIFNIYSDKISINENEIIEELNDKINADKRIIEYELAEIEMEIVDSQKIKSHLNEVKNFINEFSFEEAVLKYSVSPTSNNKGYLGWVNSAGLSDEILKLIKNLKPGEISQPLEKVNRLTFFKLINKKESSDKDSIDIEKLKTNIINQKKNELLNLYSNNHLSKKRIKLLLRSNEKNNLSYW